MDIEKRIEELEKTLMRLESRYSQSNPVDVLAMRALKREIKRLNEELAEKAEKASEKLSNSSTA